MKRSRSIYALGAILLLLSTAVAEGALVRVGRIVVRADGGFTPRVLPKRSYAPIEFHGYANVKSTDSGPVPAVRQIRLDFDRDGLLTTRGLAVCRPAQLEGTTTAQARQRCAKALVGTGYVEAAIRRPGLSGAAVREPLSFFNGPRIAGQPTALAHARTSIPSPETYVITIPIEPRNGTFAYRATIEIPELAGGEGVLTHIDAELGLKYRSKGRERSYVSARCTDGILETRGRLTFEEGTVIEGTVFRGCTPEGGF